MILSMQGQAFIFLTAVLTGFACGFVFDFFRILRKAFRHGSILTQIEDIIFWILASIIMFYMMFMASAGEVRGFSILGVFLGMVFYFATISRLIIKVSYKIIDTTKKVLHKCFKFIIIKLRRLKLFFTAKFEGKFKQKGESND